MTDETVHEEQPTPETQPEQPADTGEVLTFTPSALSSRLRRAEESAVSKLLKELGIDTPDNLKAYVTSAKQRQQAEMTEAEKLKAELETERQRAAAATEAAEKAETRRLEAIRDAAIRSAAQSAHAKVPDDVLLFARTQDLSELIGDDGEPDTKAIAKLIDTVKKDRAHWFGNGGSGTPGSPSNAGGNLSEPDKNAKQTASQQMRRFVRNSF